MRQTRGLFSVALVLTPVYIQQLIINQRVVIRIMSCNICNSVSFSSRLVADSEYTKIIMIGLLVKNVIILIRLVKISTFKSFYAKRLKGST